MSISRLFWILKNADYGVWWDVWRYSIWNPKTLFDWFWLINMMLCAATSVASVYTLVETVIRFI
jgi:hypothetical protein